MRETLIRLLSGLVYVVILLTSILFSNNVNFKSFFILFGIFLAIAVYEFCELVKINKIIPILISSALFFLDYKISSASRGDFYFYSLRYNQNLDSIILIVTLIVTIKCLFFLFDNKVTQITSLSKYIYLLGYVILPFLLISKIPFGKDGFNPQIIIGIFILIWTNDTFAYIVGKSIGKHKLYEKISPKKTIEGFIGGVLFSIIAGYFISKYYTESAIVIWLIIAAIVAVFGTIGDLIESKFKRIAGVKDSGKIMPGHGGVLDRLDSIIFAAPFVYLFYKILYYVS